MGASSSRPVISMFTEVGENDRIMYAKSTMQGWPDIQEDAAAAVTNLDQLTSFFGVYDGHGGAEVALLCARIFHIELLNHQDYETNVANALESAFFRMDELLRESGEWRELLYPRGCTQFLWTGVCADYWPFAQAYIAPQQTGSTACVAVIRGNQIIVGNVGDSRCVVSSNGQATALSDDHKPNNRFERQRIQRAGGKVIKDKHVELVGKQIYTQRVGVSRVQGVLATSRAIGDFAFKQNEAFPSEEQMVICNPTLRFFEITEDTEFLVIASDGIWECMTNQGVVDFVRMCLRAGVTDLGLICENLVECGLPSGANTTAILVQFKNSKGIPPLTDDDDDDDSKEDGDKVEDNAVDKAPGTTSNEQQSRVPAPETTDKQPLLSDEIEV